ncbi:pyrroline-5-carboxylate reductase family protein [Novosphingobium bradum]|uniref:Pyrroline-5-carboxylate reductase n=1 Tax=Novosphingobium bradum TaxID=1737444 RepID=A0ABV7ILQ0_9SPHN
MSRILLVGCGNMGGAMLTGWLAGGRAASEFTVVDPFLAEAPAGVTLLREIPAGDPFDVVLLGFKPQQFAEASVPVGAAVGPGTIVLSILAGVDLATLRGRFPQAGAMVRVMPNLAAAMGKSPIGLFGDGDGAARAAVNALMAPLGTAEWLAGEELMDVVTALAGSGPAFVYRLIDALAQGAAALGLPRDQADRLALGMVEGAGALAAASPLGPGELADRVASPGGTTRAGLDVLDADGRLARLMADTLRAARDRGAEMAAEARAKS